MDAHYGLPLGFGLGEEVGATAEDLADGLASGGEAEGALSEEAELAGAEVGLLEMEVDEGAFEMVGGAIPDSRCGGAEGRRRGGRVRLGRDSGGEGGEENREVRRRPCERRRDTPR